MTPTTDPHPPVPYASLLAFATDVFLARGVPGARARAAAQALCYGDISGHDSHGLANLTRLYLPLLDSGRAVPGAEPRVLADRGAAVLVDSRRSLGLVAAGEAMELAMARARTHGVGMVSVRNATHFGCAGFHTARAARAGMVGMLAGNCGEQRIARPPGGALPMLGTNPLSVAAPAGGRHPFVLDMSTTAAPTGKIRAAAGGGRAIPEGWLEDSAGNAVVDPGAFDRGEAHLRWLGGAGSGVYKGYGLGLMVEVLGALVAGSGFGPAPRALRGDGRPGGRDDDIGFLALAIAPGTLRPDGDVHRDSEALFGTLLACPPARTGAEVRYPGWHEGERAARCRRHGVPVTAALRDELRAVAHGLGLTAPEGM